ncbi:methyltransferase type 11 [Virgisporangium aliadipatigenens]|uniref:Methyltransferase type 11 n=1 Tax=Virgisporangium aliadipatigenens TaxID=741659 RepID=A0A8J4DP50_9ACTN|nr:class I SAM-dependent methyltransferase [Virgisporangium aliadipatigenens]GIJ44263.1 methyltransferase type 11 [Virgisporangium aliadipatigenens]
MFDELVAEGAAVPVEGWDFGWFAGRATEERPSWGYAALMGARMAAAGRALDLQTGGGEVLAGIDRPPPHLFATEGWPPNAALARERLAPLGATVVEVGEDADLPFPDGSFDLVVSRHPVTVRWDEVARVLAPGGVYLSQQVGAGTVRELADAMMGPRPVDPAREPARARAAATAAGLDVRRLEAESLRMQFFDVAAVIAFLRKVIWIVPGFTVEKYREPLRRLHGRIAAEGPFVAHSERFLIEAVKPGALTPE